MNIDIIIVNFWSSHDVAQCLARLGSWTHGIVWVVDNSQDTAEAQQLQVVCAGLGWVRVIIAGENLGFGQGCNLAFAQSSADMVLLLNPDAGISPDSIDTLIYTLQNEPHLAAVAPRMYWNPSRSFLLPLATAQTPYANMTNSLASWSRSGARLLAERHLPRMQSQLQPLATPFVVPMLAGAILLLRRQAVLSAGGLFDPGYFMFFEDADLSLRLRRVGYSLAMVPAASAEHAYRHKAFKCGMMATSQHQYFKKNYPRFYHWSDGLARVAALARPIEISDWFNCLPNPINTAQEFATHTNNGKVLAFSPSMLMTPTLFRPSFAEAKTFTEEEWNLLEPACYVALIQGSVSNSRPEWFHFERSNV